MQANSDYTVNEVHPSDRLPGNVVTLRSSDVVTCMTRTDRQSIPTRKTYLRSITTNEAPIISCTLADRQIASRTIKNERQKT